MKKKTIRIMVKILTILTLVMGTITILQTNAKIISTSAKLLSMNDSAQFYNEQVRKTDKMTDEYNEMDAERKQIYNSNDVVIRVFSNRNACIKLVVLLWAIVSFPIFGYMWLLLIFQEIRRTNIKRKKEKN